MYSISCCRIIEKKKELRKPSALLLSGLIMVFVFLTGCLSTDLEQHSVDMVQYAAYRENFSFSEPMAESPNPESSYISMEEMFYNGTLASFRQAMAHGNYFLSNWPNHEYSAMVANRSSWSSLFSLREIRGDDYNAFNTYDRNVELFCRALYYAELSVEYDRELDHHWTRRAANIRLLLEEGFPDNMDNLLLFLRSRKMAMIDAAVHMDIAYTKKAIVQLKEIREQYPEWIPEYIDQMIEEYTEFVESFKKP